MKGPPSTASSQAPFFHVFADTSGKFGKVQLCSVCPMGASNWKGDSFNIINANGMGCSGLPSRVWILSLLKRHQIHFSDLAKIMSGLLSLDSMTHPSGFGIVHWFHAMKQDWGSLITYDVTQAFYFCSEWHHTKLVNIYEYHEDNCYMLMK